jgi:hypothetical protein
MLIEDGTYYVAESGARLDPELVWLAHEHEPWRPRTM